MPSPVTIVPVPGLDEAIEKRNAQRAAEASQPVPLVPKWALALAATLAAVLVPVSAVLPHPYGAVAGIAALVCALLAGLPMPQPTFSHPLIPLTLVPLALQVGGVLALLAASLPSPAWQTLAMYGATLCYAMAGKALPAPTVPASPQ